jgi:hypothetical protein
MSSPEQKIKVHANAAFKKLGAVYFNPIGGAYGEGGVSDKIAMCRGVGIALECKALNKKPTPLQLKFLEKWAEQGGLSTWWDGNYLAWISPLSVGDALRGEWASSTGVVGAKKLASVLELLVVSVRAAERNEDR